jgi:hypothetical protein
MGSPCTPRIKEISHDQVTSSTKEGNLRRIIQESVPTQGNRLTEGHGDARQSLGVHVVVRCWWSWTPTLSVWFLEFPLVYPCNNSIRRYTWDPQFSCISCSCFPLPKGSGIAHLGSSPLGTASCWESGLQISRLSGLLFGGFMPAGPAAKVKWRECHSQLNDQTNRLSPIRVD